MKQRVKNLLTDTSLAFGKASSPIVMLIKNFLDHSEDHSGSEHEYSPFYRAINAKTPQVYYSMITVLITMITIFILWATFFKIDAFVSAAAKIETYSKVSTISSSVAVYIKEIKVKEGDKVAKGQVLATFDSDTLIAQGTENKNKYYFNIGNMAAISALIHDEAFVMPKEVSDYSDKVVKQVMQTYNVQKKYYDDGMKISTEQINQADLDFRKVTQQREYLTQEVAISEEQYLMLEGLYKKDLVSKLRYLDSKQNYTDSKMKLEAIGKEIDKASSKVQELQRKQDQFISNFKSDLQKDYNKIREDNANISATLAQIEEQLQRTVITAPVEGIIYKIPNTTVDSSIAAGQEIISIVPSNENLIVTANILPEQIGLIKEGQKATIKIASFDYTIYGALEGHVESISPETFTTQQDNKSFFKVKIITNTNFLTHHDKKHYIIPGMSANVDINVDSRTIMQYILNPIIKTVRESFGES